MGKETGISWTDHTFNGKRVDPSAFERAAISGRGGRQGVGE